MNNDKMHEELFEQCLDLGLPVSSNDDIETLQSYLDNAAEDDDFETEDLFEEAQSLTPSKGFRKLSQKLFPFLHPKLG